MEKFKKLVVLEPVRFDEEAEQKLYDYAEDVVIYRDIPETDEEKIRRIGDADALLVFYTSILWLSSMVWTREQSAPTASSRGFIVSASPSSAVW